MAARRCGSRAPPPERAPNRTAWGTKGRRGRDVLLGGEGDIDGGAGNDIVQGGSGRDRLQGQAGDDEIDGGPGVDSLDGGPGVDECRDEGSTVKGCER